MSAELVPIVASVTITIFKITEFIVKKSWKKIRYKTIKNKIYKEITKSFTGEDIDKLFEAIEALKLFDAENNKEKLKKILEKLGIDIEKTKTVEDLSNHFEELHDKKHEKSVVLDEINLYFDNVKADFLNKFGKIKE